MDNIDKLTLQLQHLASTIPRETHVIKSLYLFFWYFCVYIYIYIYILSSTVRLFVISQLLSVARHAKCFKQGSKPSWLYVHWMSYRRFIVLYIYIQREREKEREREKSIYMFSCVCVCVCVCARTCVIVYIYIDQGTLFHAHSLCSVSHVLELWGERSHSFGDVIARSTLTRSGCTC